MSTPFEPADGVEARWKKVYRVLQRTPVGDTITYEVLEGMFPGLDRASLQTVIRRAAKELLEENKRGLRNVRGKGYRVVDPTEHVQIARWHQARSVKSLERGQAAVAHVDMNGMSPEARALSEATLRGLTNQLEYIKRVDVRQQRLEKVLASTVDQTKANTDQLGELAARLAALEKQKGK